MPAPDAPTLILLGHGSTLNPDSSAPTLLHADTLRQTGHFAEVLTAFWKEEPSFREVLHSVDTQKVYLVPNFISEGYFCQQVLPRELGLQDWVTSLSDGRTLCYCLPVGSHPRMKDLILQRADEVAPQVPRSEMSLIIVGHGTGLNENSTKAIKDQVRLIQESDAGFAEVLDAYMEEPPLISDWQQLATSPHVVVVPFFIADGLHSYQDIPVMLGIESEPTAAASQRDVFRNNPHQVGDRWLYFSGAIGTAPDMSKVILDQIRDFDSQLQEGTLPPCPFKAESEAEHSQPSSPAPLSNPAPLLSCLQKWLDLGFNKWGEVCIQGSQNGSQWTLFHEADLELAQENLASLQEISDRQELRKIALLDQALEFRPLKTTRTLRTGWKFTAHSLQELRNGLEELYPGLLGVFRSAESHRLTSCTLPEFFGRQTGMYQITQKLDAQSAEQVTQSCCETLCMRRRLWAWDASPTYFPDLPELLCLEPCSLYLGEARKFAKKMFNSASSAPEPV